MTPRGATLARLMSLSLAGSAIAQHRQIGAKPENVSVPAEGETVPMLDFGGRPVVAVMINGRGPYKFILDTGAAGTVVDSSLAAELSLQDPPSLKEVRAGKVVLREVQTFVAPISQMLGSGDVPRGVLSASSFPGSLVRFDATGKRIAFIKGSLAEPDGASVFSYDPADLPSLPVKLGGLEVTVHLDTGAPYALALPTKYMHELPLSAPAVQKGKAKTHSGALPIFVAPFAGEVRIGKFKLATNELRFTDLVPFAAAEPKGQVGSEALRDFEVTLDSLNHRVRLEKAKAR